MSRPRRAGGGSGRPRSRGPPRPRRPRGRGGPARRGRSCGGDLLGQALGPPLRGGAAGEVPEGLAVVVVLLVEREDLEQLLVEVPVRDLADHHVAELRLGAEAPADADVHGLDELAVDLLEHALDADVGDLVLGARRRAAGEVQAEVAAVAVGQDMVVEELRDLYRPPLRVDLGQTAELLAGAGL